MRTYMAHAFRLALGAFALTGCAASDATQVGDRAKVTLTIESWRNDDLSVWRDKIIPAFESKHPNIRVVFAPTAPAAYDAGLSAKLASGTAGDLITCRPFDTSLALFSKGQLLGLNTLPGLSNFGDVARSAWITDDGKTVYCVPMASVIHGFFYNKDVFDKYGITEPDTRDQFTAALRTLKARGETALVMGTAERWESATVGFQNIGPNYWKGEDGRKALIAGTAKYTDAPYTQTWAALATWAPYLPADFATMAYSTAQSRFALAKGAIYPTGSWEIAQFRKEAAFTLGIFPPPVGTAGDACYISDHTDIAMGLNAASKHPAEARLFLEWLTSREFAELYSNALPGFFTLASHQITLTDPLANEFLSWRTKCKSTIRNASQILSRGDPSLENELWRVTAAVLNGTLTPAQAGQEVQTGLEKWYRP